MVMYSVIIFSVSGLNTLSVRVRVVSLSGLCPVRVMFLSGLCPCPGCVCPGCVLSRLRPVQVVSCPGYVPVRVVSVRVVSVRVASCPGCVCPGYVVAPFLAWWNPTMLFIFYLFISSYPLTRIIQPHRIVVFIYTDTFWPHSCILSANSIFKSKSWVSLLNAYWIQKILTLLIFVHLTQLCTNFVLVLLKTLLNHHIHNLDTKCFYTFFLGKK